MSACVLTFDSNGTASCLYTELIDLKSIGSLQVTRATQIEFKTLPKDALVKPSKGKEMTAEEFKKIEAEKMKEMGMETGGGGAPGTMRMIIRN